MTPDERLTEVFDRGHKKGLDSLSESDRDLYRIQYFILGFEMDGLSGYLYNVLPDLKGLRATVAAMRRFNLLKLAEFVDEAASLFDNYVDPNPTTTWDIVHKQYDPQNRLRAIEKQIAALRNFELDQSTIH